MLVFRSDDKLASILHSIDTRLAVEDNLRWQAELETKYGKYMKAAINMDMPDGEPYVI